MIIGILATLLLFDRYIAVIRLIISAVGDSAAGFVGELYGKTRFRQKTLEDSYAFITG